MWRRQCQQLHVVVREQFGRLIVGPLVAVRAQPRLVHDMIRNVLGVLDRGPRVVDSLVALAWRRMEPELHFIEAVREAEEGEVGTFDRGDGLVALAIILLALIVGCDRDEMSELLCGQKVLQQNALIHLMVESDLVEGLLEVPSQQLVINERLLRQEMQVLLEWFSYEVLAQRLEYTHLRGLGLEEGEHAPGDTDNREVLVFITVMLSRPLQDLMHLGQVLPVFEALFSVSGDVDSRDAREFSMELS